MAEPSPFTACIIASGTIGPMPDQIAFPWEGESKTTRPTPIVTWFDLLEAYCHVLKRQWEKDRLEAEAEARYEP